jgi:hypothetical protein
VKYFRTGRTHDNTDDGPVDETINAALGDFSDWKVETFGQTT